MRVICIRPSTHNIRVATGEHISLSKISVGSKYTVVDVTEVYGHCAYELSEFPPQDGRQLFSAKLFAEITDLDETTLVTEEFEEKYCVPVNR